MARVPRLSTLLLGGQSIIFTRPLKVDPKKSTERTLQSLILKKISHFLAKMTPFERVTV